MTLLMPNSCWIFITDSWVGILSICIQVSLVRWPRIIVNSNLSFTLSLFRRLAYLETSTLKISLSTSVESVDNIASGSIIFFFYLQSVHQTFLLFVHSFPMYLAISHLMWVNQSTHRSAESNTRSQPLRPSHVPSNLGVASGAPHDVFTGTAALDFS